VAQPLHGVTFFLARILHSKYSVHMPTKTESTEQTRVPMRVENNTAHLISGPPTFSFPNGVSLLPGMNTWPSLYHDELTKLTSKVVAHPTKPDQTLPPRQTGLKFLEEMQRSVGYSTANGRQFGPQLTFFYEKLEDLPDGPKLPPMLTGNERMDLAFVDQATVKHNRPLLENWLQSAKGSVKAAIQAKLRG